MKLKYLSLAPGLVMVAALAGFTSHENDPQDLHYEKRIGEATSGTTSSVSNQIMRRFGFVVNTQTLIGPPTIRRESEWLDREPFEDEAAEGVVVAQSRIVVRSRGRGSTAGGRSQAQTYRLIFTLENQVQMADSEEWVEMPMTEEFEEWAKEIAEEMESELRSRR